MSLEKIAAATITLALGASPVLADEPRAAAPAALAKTVVTGFQTGALDPVFALFDDAMKSAIPRAKLDEVRNGLVGQVGALRFCGEPRTSTQGAITTVRAACTFEKASLDLKIAVKDGLIAGLRFLPPEAPYQAPAYERTGAFRETDVTVGKGDWALPGTLSMPTGPGPFPALVLVHGSGPQDRDESYGTNRPFRDLASGLASRGIAVLRYDKRTAVHGAKLMTAKSLTVNEETVEDAVLAVRLLKSTPGIDPSCVFVLGHSLGGMLAPRIAKAEPTVAGLVILAGTTRPLPEVIVDQTAYLGSLKGEADRATLEQMRKEALRVNEVTSSTAGLVLGAPASYWLDLKDYRPADLARTLPQPILVLQGERDYQVTMKDMESWKKALDGRPGAVLKTYPRLNHFFMVGDGKSTPDEYERPGHVAPAILDDVEAFVKKKG